MDNFDELLAAFKALLGIKKTENARDAELTGYLNTAIAACDRYLDRLILSQRDVSETFINVHTPRVLRWSPVGDLVSVTLDDVDVLSAWEIVKFTDYAELRHVDDYRYCIDYDERLVVTYQAGLMHCPDDLIEAISYAAGALESQRGAGAAAPGFMVRKEMVTGVGTLEYDLEASVAGTRASGFLPPQTIQVLDRYRGDYGR